MLYIFDPYQRLESAPEREGERIEEMYIRDTKKEGQEEKDQNREKEIFGKRKTEIDTQKEEIEIERETDSIIQNE